MSGLNRREVLVAGLAASVVRAAGTSHGIVLVHGAWHGGWCWDAVVKGLAALGHVAVAPTLTGLAEREKELNAQTTLATHVADVVEAAAQFDRVVLVGHSYAGLVITQAVDPLGKKLERLVYLDAFLPAVGQSGFDLMKKAYGDHWKEKAAGGLSVPPMLSAKAMGVLDEKQAKAVDARLTPHPLATFEAKVQFDEAAWKAVPRTYLRCAKYAGFGPTAERAKTLGLDVVQLDAGHDAMLAAPGALVAAIDRAVKG